MEPTTELTPQERAALRCCGHDPLRPGMHQPFHQDGWNMATDAHLIFGWQGEPVTTGHEKAPNAIGIFLRNDAPLEEPFVLFRSALNTALGSLPKVLAKCEMCEGRKNCTCQDCGKSHECGNCNGTGYTRHGTPTEFDESAIVELKGIARFKASKLDTVQIVMRIMDVEHITITHGAPNRAAVTTFRGGERLLFMPNMELDGEEVKATITNGQL